MENITKDYQLWKNRDLESYPLHQMNLWTCCLFILRNEQPDMKSYAGSF